MKSNDRPPSSSFRGLLVILIILNLVVLGWILFPRLDQFGIHLGDTQPVRAWFGDATAQPGETSSPTGASEGLPTENLAAAHPGGQQGLILLSMRDGNISHLFLYDPYAVSLTRLTNSPWDEITPAISPDQTRLAYAARQNGYWDLYLLDLKTGQQTRLTDTPEYEANPTWSPDGQWIAYEKYNGVSLDIYIQSLADLSSAPLQLTNDPGIDRSPAWSPKGREIAFVSTRSGDKEIWLARLDAIDNRFSNLSNNSAAENDHPVWSSDGQSLAWATNLNGARQIEVWNPDQPSVPAHRIGDGDLVLWSSDPTSVFSVVRSANNEGITGYEIAQGRLTIPFTPLPGELYGMTWINSPLPAWLAQAVENPDQTPVPTLWQAKQTETVLPSGRSGLVALADVTAPQPMLHDAVDESFAALRQQIANETGWDALSSLENAYVPLNAPPDPSVQDDWLYTGRAFAINSLLQSAGWLAIVPDNFNGQMYWRIYLKARYQDGSMGLPLSEMTWDINARYSGEPRAYEQGGKITQPPAGFWIDLTELTHRYAWDRQPSLVNWRTFYPAMHFNEFVLTGGLNWDQAMAELYPPEALVTVTPMPTRTPTINPTTHATLPPATRTPIPTLTQNPTRRPTWTPLAATAQP